MLPLIHKYAPKEIEDILGQENAIRELDRFISGFRKSRKKAVILHGPIGVGKSSSAYVIARKHNLEIIEVNASDFRNKDQINQKVGNALKQQSLFSKGKIILVDDIDGLSGTKDRGGVQAITKLIQNSNFPILLTAENIYIDKLRSLVRKCIPIKFDLMGYDAIFNILKKICNSENIKCGDKSLKALAYRSAGDARAAINDLQTLTQLRKNISIKDIDELFGRNRKSSILNALKLVLKSTNLETALGAFNNIDEDIDKQMLWLDENVPKEYTKVEDLARAYDMLSKADVFKRRIRRWQYYRFYVYINALLTGGIAVSKDKKYDKFVEYKPTRKLLKIWMINQKLARKKSIAGKIASKLHVSTRVANRDIIPFFKEIYKNDRKIRNNIIEEFELSNEEVEWLRK